jgi:hypothetical protein
MRFVLVFGCMVFLSGISFAQKYPCLPQPVTESSVVRTTIGTSRDGSMKVTKVTVGQTLRNLKARCRRGQLVDRNGRGIRFYTLQNCWGNPPENYQELIATQRREIAALKRKYTVVEMTCNTGGGPPPASPPRLET